MKRLFSFMMALVLILALGVTAFAAPGTDGSITISNATIDKSYKLYKIFNATYNTDGDVTYTIDSGNQFFDDLFGNGTGSNDYFTYHASTGVVTRKDGKTDADLFAYLATLVASGSPDQEKTADDTSLDFTGLTTGYYVIKRADDTANAVTITTAKPHADVNDKNALPGGDFEKTADKNTAAVGDTISWTLSFTATNYAKDKKVLSYTVKDALERSWAAIDYNNITVKVNGAEIAKTAWDLVSGSNNGFVINIPWVDTDGNFKYAASAKVEVTYSATVLDAAAANDPTSAMNKNHAELDWTTTDGTEDGPDDDTDTEVYNLGFTKVDGTDPSKTLPGAVFGLYSDNACTFPVNVKAIAEGVYMVDKTSTSNAVTTPASGQVIIMGLDKATYYLKETTAPDGYNLLTAAQAVEVGNGSADEMKIGDTTYIVNNAEINIANNSGVELPSTGGKGTMMLITIGTMVAMAFAVLLITHKKMSIYHD